MPQFYYRTDSDDELIRCRTKREAMEKARSWVLAMPLVPLRYYAEVFRGPNAKQAVRVAHFWKDTEHGGVQHLDF